MNRSTTRGQTARYQKQPVMPRGPPQPSIRSSHAFNQPPPPPQLNYRTQQQQQQQQYEDGLVEQSTSAKPPMSIKTAITLLSMRMSRAEQKLLDLPALLSSNSDYSGESLGDGDKEHIFERLNALETKTFNSNSIDYKQSIDMLTQAIAQIRNSNSAILKENKELKNSFANFKQELSGLKDNLSSLNQGITQYQMKLLELEISLAGQPNDYENEFEENVECSSVDDLQNDNVLQDYDSNVLQDCNGNVLQNCDANLELNLTNGDDIKF